MNKITTFLILYLCLDCANLQRNCCYINEHNLLFQKFYSDNVTRKSLLYSKSLSQNNLFAKRKTIKKNCKLIQASGTTSGTISVHARC